MTRDKLNPPALPRLGDLPMDRVVNFASHKYWGVSDPDR